MQVAKFFQSVTSDGHLPIGVLIFVIATLVYIFKGVNGDYVAITAAVLAFLGGHEYLQPDPPASGGK